MPLRIQTMEQHIEAASADFVATGLGIFGQIDVIKVTFRRRIRAQQLLGQFVDLGFAAPPANRALQGTVEVDQHVGPNFSGG